MDMMLMSATVAAMVTRASAAVESVPTDDCPIFRPDCQVEKVAEAVAGVGAVAESVGAVADFASDPFGYIAEKMQAMASSLATDILPALTSALKPDLSAEWFLEAYAFSFAAAIFVMALQLLWTFVQVGRRQISGADAIDSVVFKAPLFMIGAAFGPAIGQLLIRFIEALTNTVLSLTIGGTADSVGAGMESLIASGDPAAMTGGSIAAIVIFFVLALGLLFILATLLVMLVTLYMSGVVFPLGWVWVTNPRHKARAMKIVQVWVGILLMEPLLFFMLGVALMLSSASLLEGQLPGSESTPDGLRVVIGLLVAIIALWTAAFSPVLLAKFAPILPTDGAASGGVGKANMPSFPGGGGGGGGSKMSGLGAASSQQAQGFAFRDAGGGGGGGGADVLAAEGAGGAASGAAGGASGAGGAGGGIAEGAIKGGVKAGEAGAELGPADAAVVAAGAAAGAAKAAVGGAADQAAELADQGGSGADAGAAAGSGAGVGAGGSLGGGSGAESVGEFADSAGGALGGSGAPADAPAPDGSGPGSLAASTTGAGGEAGSPSSGSSGSSAGDGVGEGEAGASIGAVPAMGSVDAGSVGSSGGSELYDAESGSASGIGESGWAAGAVGTAAVAARGADGLLAQSSALAANQMDHQSSPPPPSAVPAPRPVGPRPASRRKGWFGKGSGGRR